MNLNTDNIKTLYMLGIGGIGMSALARYFHAMGARVSGYDRTSTPLTSQLMEEGIDIHFEDDPSKIPANIDLVIYTPAIPADLNELVHLSQTAVPIKKRAEILGQLSNEASTIAVSGTHGKTTVSTMIAHILHSSKIGCSAFLGGISRNYNSNFLYSGSSEYMVVEADEFDKSFLQLKPRFTVVTSMDADHLDIYSDYNNLKETFRDFISCTQSGGNILIKKGVDLNYKPADCNIYRYSIDDQADFYAENFRIINHRYVFDLITPEKKILDLTLQMPGLINVENAVAATAISLLCGVEEQEIRDALADFQGINRRFDIRIQNNDLVYIDDYAHHPEEIRALITSVRNLFPGKTILGIFQPHLFSRTRDFADGFAESLSLLDEIVLLPIYPAREQPIHGVEAGMILNKIEKSNKILLTKEGLFSHEGLTENDIILTIGAGDIDQLVKPLENDLLKLIKT